MKVYFQSFSSSLLIEFDPINTTLTPALLPVIISDNVFPTKTQFSFLTSRNFIASIRIFGLGFGSLISEDENIFGKKCKILKWHNKLVIAPIGLSEIITKFALLSNFSKISKRPSSISLNSKYSVYLLLTPIQDKFQYSFLQNRIIHLTLV